MDINILRYNREAKHSFAILLGFVGDTDSRCNHILLKWPDAIDAYVSDDKKKYLEDMAALLCVPIKIIAESLEDVYNQKSPERIDIRKEIDDTLQMSAINPIESKNNLISICNQVIFKLRSVGVAHEYVKTIGDG